MLFFPILILHLSRFSFAHYNVHNVDNYNDYQHQLLKRFLLMLHLIVIVKLCGLHYKPIITTQGHKQPCLFGHECNNIIVCVRPHSHIITSHKRLSIHPHPSPITLPSKVPLDHRDPPPPLSILPPPLSSSPSPPPSVINKGQLAYLPCPSPYQ